MCLTCIAAVTAGFPYGIPEVSKCEVFLTGSEYSSHFLRNPFAVSNSPVSVSERADPALFPYQTAAAPGPDCETGSAHSPSVQ